MDDPEQAAQGGAAAARAITGQLEYLPACVAAWEARSATRPDAAARRAASDSIDIIDDALAALHVLRASLISEVQQADREHAEAVDELLAGGPGRKLHEGPGAS